MKYTYKFEEMIDARNEAIGNLERVKNEQTRLVEILKEHDEKENNKSLKFTNLIEELTNKLKETEETIKNYKAQNENTIKLVLMLKKIDKDVCKVVEDVLDEIGLFKTPELPKENKKEEK